jgi:hypothetical protein
MSSNKIFYNISPNIRDNYGSGFFANYRISLSKLISFHNQNIDGIPYVNWSRTLFVEGFTCDPTYPECLEKNPKESSYNPFDFWFEQQIPNSHDKILNFEHNILSGIINHSKNYWKESGLDIQRVVDNLYIKPKRHLIENINNTYKNYFEGGEILGVVARSTEYQTFHKEYGFFTPENYIRTIEKILSMNNEIKKIFIVCEDLEFLLQIKNHFNSISFYLENVYRRTDEPYSYVNKTICWPNFSNRRENHCRLLGEETIIQTKLLGQCDYLVGGHSGVMSGAILWGEKIKNFYLMK